MANTKRSANKGARYHKHMMLASLLALVLAIGCTVGSTLAWIVSRSDLVENTFTYGDIDIDLTETDTVIDGDEKTDTNTYMMARKAEITKDPKVTIKAGSEACWLFVKLEKSANFDEFMTCEYADGWTELEGTDDSAIILYRKVDAPKNDAEFGVLKDDKVTVKDITDDMLNALGPDDGDTPYPTLNITAYAVQYAGFEHSETTTENAVALSAWNAAHGVMPPAGSSGSTAAVSDDAADTYASLYYWGEDSLFTIDPKQ